MQRDPVLHVSVDISSSVCSCVHRSLDIRPCIRVISDLASSASRVALSASLERDFHHAPPPERVTSLSVPPFVPPPQAHHRQDHNCQLSLHLDDGCFPVQPMMVVPRDCRLRQVWNWIGRCTDAFAAARLQWDARDCRNHDLFSSLHRVPRHGGCVVCCRISWSSGNGCATTRFESSRSDVGRRRIVRVTAMPTLVPMR